MKSIQTVLLLILPLILVNTLKLSNQKHQFTTYQHLLSGDFSHKVDWGHYNSNDQPSSTNTNWITQLPGNRKISQMSIPGTHDSGTYGCSWWQACDISQCQSWSITGQLRAGIRFLDIRVDSVRNPMSVVHGPYSYHYLYQILNQVNGFLRENPREFVILSIQQASSQNFYLSGQKIAALLGQSGINCVYSASIPIIDQLRGKAWIIEAAGISFPRPTFSLNTGKDGITTEAQSGSYYLQNIYTVWTTTTSTKTNAVRQTFLKPCSANILKVNFMSASSGVMPYWFAKNDDFPNQSTDVWLKNSPGPKCLGIAVMDYPGTRLIRQIIESNNNLQFINPISIPYKALLYDAPKIFNFKPTPLKMP